MIMNCWFKENCKIANTEGCSVSCIKYAEVNFLFESSGIPKKQRIALDCPVVDKDVYDYLANLDIANLSEKDLNIFICSTKVGNGKTSWAMKLLQRYIAKKALGNGFRDICRFVHVPTQLSKFKDFNNEKQEHQKETLINMDLIVWDDIGMPISDFDRQQLLNIIDRRILLGKANIYTSNVVEYDYLEESIGARLASRVFNYSEVVVFKSKDKRGIRS